MKRTALKDYYDQAYAQDSMRTFDGEEERRAIFDFMPSWKGLRVLEIGCGTGELAAMIATAGAEVHAVDQSIEAISQAVKTYDIPLLTFWGGDYNDVIAGVYDVVVMQGVLEHLDNPFEELEHILSFVDTVITSSPNFLNPRGYVWMTFQYLLGVEMSMADKHFLAPWDFAEFCGKHKLNLKTKTVDQDWGAGPRMIIDFHKRFKSQTFKDRFMDEWGQCIDDSSIDRFLEWMGNTVGFFELTEHSGANIVYKITKGG